MASWAIGDLQGCYAELTALLEKIQFNADRDRLWFTGDLVNRGPDSLACLRFVRDLGDNAITVLGNHDLHLLATAYGARKISRKDSFTDVLKAPDRDALLDWLLHRPLLHHDSRRDTTLVHAGLPPQWDLPLAQQEARHTEATIQAQAGKAFFEDMYGDQPTRWSDTLSGMARVRFAINAFTRMRLVTRDGELDLSGKGPPASAAAGHLPWFRAPERRHQAMHIVFGHWSTLGDIDDPGIFALDSGCLWGGSLTALNLDQPDQRVRLPCTGYAQPGQE